MNVWTVDINVLGYDVDEAEPLTAQGGSHGLGQLQLGHAWCADLYAEASVDGDVFRPKGALGDKLSFRKLGVGLVFLVTARPVERAYPKGAAEGPASSSVAGRCLRCMPVRRVPPCRLGLVLWAAVFHFASDMRLLPEFDKLERFILLQNKLQVNVVT